MGWLDIMFPSFAELEAQAHAEARGASDARLHGMVRAVLAQHGSSMDPAVVAEIEGALEGGRAPAASRWLVALREGLAASGYLVRPGTVEDLWLADGALTELARRASG